LLFSRDLVNLERKKTTNMIARICYRWMCSNDYRCNHRKLHNITTREQLWQYSLLLLTKP